MVNASRNNLTWLESNLANSLMQPPQGTKRSLADILYSIFSHCLDSPETVKNINLSCRQFQQIMTRHPFVVLADAIYRLAHAKEEELPQLIQTLHPPKEAISYKFTQEQLKSLQELDPLGMGLSRFLECSSLVSSLNTSVLTQILEHVFWVIPSPKTNHSPFLKSIFSTCQEINNTFSKEKNQTIDWQIFGETLVHQGFHLFQCYKSLTSHALLATHIKSSHEAGKIHLFMSLLPCDE